jgi:hypothetical protein
MSVSGDCRRHMDWMRLKRRGFGVQQFSNSVREGAFGGQNRSAGCGVQ